MQNRPYIYPGDVESRDVSPLPPRRFPFHVRPNGLDHLTDAEVEYLGTLGIVPVPESAPTDEQISEYQRLSDNDVFGRMKRIPGGMIP
jgi:hypothetical protein